MTEHLPDTSFYESMRTQILETPLVAPHGRPVWRHGRPSGLKLGLLSGASTALVAAVVAIVLALGATASAPPAYAVTRHADGSITITLRNLTTGIPALNQRLREMKIDETVLPIRSDCHVPRGADVPVMHPNRLLELKGSVSTTYTPAASRTHPATRGFHYVLAAKRMANGKLLAFIGALKAPLPDCVPYSSTPGFP